MVSRRRFLHTLSAGSSLALAGCSALDPDPNERPPERVGTDWSPSPGEWRFPAADLHNTASVSLPATGEPETAWTTPAPGDTLVGRVVAATRDTVVAAARREETTTVTAHGAVDGTERWRRDLGEARFGGLVDGSLYAAADGREVVALDAADGTVRWRTNLHRRLLDEVPERYVPESVASPRSYSMVPMATPDTVYVQSGYGLHGLDPADGAERWRVFVGDGAEGDRTVDEARGFAVGPDRCWLTYAEPRSRVLSVAADEDEPRVDGESVPERHAIPPVVTAGDHHVLALGPRFSASTGFRTSLASGNGGWWDDWSFPGFHVDESGVAVGRPATDGDRVFVVQAHAAGEGLELGLAGLHAGSGRIEWTRREPLDGSAPDGDLFDGVRLARPAVAGDTLLVAAGTPDSDAQATDGTLFGFSCDSGEVRWRVGVDLAPWNVAVAGDRIYVSGDRGGVAALARSG